VLVSTTSQTESPPQLTNRVALDVKEVLQRPGLSCFLLILTALALVVLQEGVSGMSPKITQSQAYLNNGLGLRGCFVITRANALRYLSPELPALPLLHRGDRARDDVLLCPGDVVERHTLAVLARRVPLALE
jgi:hypothetical protein